MCCSPWGKELDTTERLNNNKGKNLKKLDIYVFPDSSVSKESACDAGDPGLIPGSGRSVGEGLGYPLQYSWASLVAQLVKNVPEMQDTWVRSLGWEDHLLTIYVSKQQKCQAKECYRPMETSSTLRIQHLMSA